MHKIHRLGFALFTTLSIVLAVACTPATTSDAPGAPSATTTSPRHLASLAPKAGTMVYATPSLGAEAGALVSTSGNSRDLNVSAFDAIQIDINVTAVDRSDGGAGTVQFSWQRKGADGNYYTVWTGAAYGAGSQSSQTIGSGFAAITVVTGDSGITVTGLGQVGRLVWTLGSGALSATFSASVQAA